MQTSGPGRLTFYIDMSFKGREATLSENIWFDDGGVALPKDKIYTTSRIGVEYAGPVWAKKNIALSSNLMICGNYKDMKVCSWYNINV